MNKVRAAYKRSLAKDEDRMKTVISSSKCSMWGGFFLEKNLSPQPLENQPLSGKCQKNLKKTCEKVW
jgi:hypothetical protein